MGNIKVENVAFGYNNNRVLKDISIQFNKGSLYGIIGPNGCGKSTFLNILGGILKRFYGNVVIDDSNIGSWSTRQMAKTLAYVQQQSPPIEFDFTVFDVIMMGRYAYIDRFSSESEEDKKIIKQIIQKLNLSEISDRNFRELSGGEQQKVLIARSLAQHSKILLLDEPTSHLDINYQLEYMDLFRKLISEGIIVIAVIHDLNLAAQYCNKIILMTEGRIHKFGTIEETLTYNNILEVFQIDTIIKRNPITNTLFITPLHKKEKYLKNEINIHVIVGGGTATKILPLLKNFNVSVGVVNVLDEDYDLAQTLGYDIISEAPFSPISEISLQNLKETLSKVDYIILSNVPFGKANIKNLETLLEFSQPILIFEESPIQLRDFLNGEASRLYDLLLKSKNVQVITTTDQFETYIHKIGGKKLSD